MRYEYHGLTSSGDSKHGFIQAADQNAVVSKLQKKGIFATQIRVAADDSQAVSIQGLNQVWDQVLTYIPVKTSQKVFSSDKWH
ncbi:hypothetical protein GCM10025856_04040 [Methylophaga marina]|uniref:hypothetical protein n=1 Tax=Methylophaga marina TaxID=45495 RepID=UPI0025748DC4|nr:hypothetical protein [Methylophaga marina]BDZ72685.1 hypothetical protein GCM10025856_04040 [Methylophaga marina]